MGGAVDRWTRLVLARRGEVERLEAAPLDAGFWDRRAERYGQRMGVADGDPFLERVRRHVGATTVVLDVGAGTGRFAVPLATTAAEIVAVDPSQGMLDVLEREAKARGLANVRGVHGSWPDVADVVTSDVTICSYVLPIVADVAPFLTRLDAVTRRRVLLYLGAGGDLLHDPLWRHFHDHPRPPMPTYLDAMAVLDELGITAEVEVVEVPVRTSYGSLAQAIEDHRDLLLLPDTDAVRAELERLLAGWLAHRDGALRPPARTLPAAIVSWTPRPR